MSIFNDYMRLCYCFIYLIISLANVITVNLYLATPKKLWKLAKIFFGIVTFTTVTVSTFFVSGYANGSMSLSLFPLVPIGFLYAAFAACSFVLGIGIFISLRLTKIETHVQGEVE